MAGGLLDDDDLAEAHEINVTPFIDVMLVLLIIFMVAAPLATVDVNVDLPVSNAPASGRPDTPVWLSVGPDLGLSLGNDPVTAEALRPRLDELTGGDPETRIYLRADQAVAYGDLMGVMNRLRDAGYLKIALVGLDPASAPPGMGSGAAETSSAVPGGGPAGRANMPAGSDVPAGVDLAAPSSAVAPAAGQSVGPAGGIAAPSAAGNAAPAVPAGVTAPPGAADVAPATPAPAAQP